MVEFLDDVLQFSLKRDCSLGELTKGGGLHKRKLLKYHKPFPILVFEGFLSIERVL